MSDGASDYWRAQRAKQKEEKIIRDFMIFVNCIIRNEIAPHKMLKDMDDLMNRLFETMVIK